MESDSAKNESLWVKKTFMVAATELFIILTISKNERFWKESIDLVFKLFNISVQGPCFSCNR